MARKRKNPDTGPITMDITPLIDCVFLLIVFFVVAGKFKKVESRLDAYLPKDMGMDSSSTPPDPDKFFIGILCQNDQKNQKMKWIVNLKEVDTKKDLVDMIKKIRDEAGKAKSIKVTIDGDPQVQFFWYIASLDACAEAELTEIMFMPPRVKSLDSWPRPIPRLLQPALGKMK